MASPLRTALALRLGLFVLGGIALAVGAVVLLIGGWFDRTEPVEMRFRGSVQGLHVGAPVVLRGVPVGLVTRIGLASDGDGLAIPVQAQIRPQALGGQTLPALLERGLVARLATKSLLSGQLYVDLDLRPQLAAELIATADGRPAAGGAAAAAPGTAVAVATTAEGRWRIPATGSWQQGLQQQLEAVDLRTITGELSATLTSARTLLQSPDVKRTLAELAVTSANLARLSAALEQRVPALAQRTEGTLAAAAGAAERIGAAAERGGAAAVQVGAAASSAQALLAPDAPLATSVRRTADELARTAAALREASQRAEPTLADTERALEELARAARAVRELAELLERDPQALLRGRGSPP